MIRYYNKVQFAENKKLRCVIVHGVTIDHNNVLYFWKQQKKCQKEKIERSSFKVSPQKNC